MEYTVNDIIQRAIESPESVIFDVNDNLIGCYYNFIPSVSSYIFEFDFNNERVKTSVLKKFYFDFRRFWKLAVVFFDETPVMIIQNAGREGDDHRHVYVLNKDAYDSMCYYLNAVKVLKDDKPHTKLHICDTTFVDDFSEVDRKYTDFYNNNLEGYFERFN